MSPVGQLAPQRSHVACAEARPTPVRAKARIIGNLSCILGMIRREKAVKYASATDLAQIKRIRRCVQQCAEDGEVVS